MYMENFISKRGNLYQFVIGQSKVALDLIFFYFYFLISLKNKKKNIKSMCVISCLIRIKKKNIALPIET